jgi:hypothetical protein
MNALVDAVLPVLIVAAIVAILGNSIRDDLRHRRLRRGRMLAVTGPFVDEESPTHPKARVRIWERKAAGTWPIYRLPPGWNRRA